MSNNNNNEFKESRTREDNDKTRAKLLGQNATNSMQNDNGNVNENYKFPLNTPTTYNVKSDIIANKQKSSKESSKEKTSTYNPINQTITKSKNFNFPLSTPIKKDLYNQQYFSDEKIDKDFSNTVENPLLNKQNLKQIQDSNANFKISQSDAPQPIQYFSDKKIDESTFSPFHSDVASTNEIKNNDSNTSEVTHNNQGSYLQKIKNSIPTLPTLPTIPIISLTDTYTFITKHNKKIGLSLIILLFILLFVFVGINAASILATIIFNLILIYCIYQYTENKDTTFIIYAGISFLILSLILGFVFNGFAILINIFALILTALLISGGYGVYNMISGKIDTIYKIPAIILLTVTFIAIILGIFILVFPPNNDPNNPNTAYENILTIIYVLGSIALFIIAGFIIIWLYHKYKTIPTIISLTISYFSKLISSIIGIILYMVFMTYFYNYGGLLTIFSKKTRDGKYDDGLKTDGTNQPINPKSLNDTVANFNKYKNTAMIILAPLSILIGLYILYRGYKVESNTMNPTFDKFKQIMIAILSIIFLIYIWTLDPEKSTFHNTIQYFFSGNMLVIEIVIAVFGLIFALLNIFKDFFAVVPKSEVASGVASGAKAVAASGAKAVAAVAGVAAAGVAAVAAVEIAVAASVSKENTPKNPILLIAYIIIYMIFIIIMSVGLTKNYFTPKQPHINSKYSIPSNSPPKNKYGYGICPNNLESKTDLEGSQCTPCKNTQFGCCDDGITAKIYYTNANKTTISNTITTYTNCGILQTATDKLDTATDKRAIGAIILIIIVSIVWLVFTGIELNKLGYFKGFNRNEILASMDFFRKIGIIVAGIIVSSLIIYVLVTSINGLVSKKNAGVVPFLVNLITILVILGIVYKILNLNINPKVNQTYSLILDIIFYIPCLFITLYNNLPGISTPNVKDFSQPVYIMILIGVIILYVIYFYLFNFSKIYTQNGTIILKDKVNLNQFTAVSNYLKLNKLDENSVESNNIPDTNNQGTIKYNYNYGMSFWIYLDSINTSQIDKYLTILNYGDKPTVEYNPSKNILRISVSSNEANINATPNIIYSLPNVLLQKWNNIIINYIGGTIDIFINGELVSSTQKISPFMSYDALTVGQDNGINGGICNLIYFIKPLSSKQIHYLYNSVKELNPPIIYDSTQTMDNITYNK